MRWLYIAAILSIAIVLTLAGWGFYKESVARKKCEELEFHLRGNKELPENMTCHCFPGEGYVDQLDTPEIIKEKADLYILVCNKSNETQIFPVWITSPP